MTFWKKDKSGHPARKKRLEKQQQWTNLFAKLQSRFEKEKQARLDANYWVSLDVFTDTQSKTAQLALGNHIVGQDTHNPNIFIGEDGGALVVEQIADGSIVVSLHPRKSSLYHPKENILIWAIYDFPKHFRSWKIELAIHDLFLYIDVTSSGLSPSRWASARIWWLRLQQNLRQKKENNLPLAWALKSSKWLLGLIGIASAFSTLMAISAPQALDMLHPMQSAAVRDMPVIEGHYTLCPDENTEKKSNIPGALNFLYDISQNNKGVVFLDIELDIPCTLPPNDTKRAFPDFSRTTDRSGVSYEFHIPLLDAKDKQAIASVISGGRDYQKIRDIYSDNGVYMNIDGTTTNRNRYSGLELHDEGMWDRIYGPYQIKATSSDGSLTYELSAPSLEGSTAAAAALIDAERRKLPASSQVKGYQTPNLPITIAAPPTLPAGSKGGQSSPFPTPLNQQLTEGKEMKKPSLPPLPPLPPASLPAYPLPLPLTTEK